MEIWRHEAMGCTALVYYYYRDNMSSKTTLYSGHNHREWAKLTARFCHSSLQIRPIFPSTDTQQN